MQSCHRWIFIISALAIIIYLATTYFTDYGFGKTQQHPYVNRSVIEIIEMNGYPVEVHEVITEDGYVLELHRIPGNWRNPDPRGKSAVLLMHGLICSSSVFVLAGPERALAFVLADAGYDVWMGNARGSRYSRKHLHRSIDESEYWDFSWHEIGVKDLPPTIDYILANTGQQRLFYIGHSQGNTVYFVMLSELPEYNDKICAMFALGPVVYTSNTFSPFLMIAAKFSNSLQALLSLIGLYQFAPSSGSIKTLLPFLCQTGSLLQVVCKNVIFLITGYNNDQMEEELIPVILDHLPAGVGTKQLYHYAQLTESGYFRQFDYGREINRKMYGQTDPPSYNFSNVLTPVSVHYSVNDWISHPKDVDQLYFQLKNTIGKFRVPDDKFNHADFFSAKDVKDLLYNEILNIMEHYKY